MQVLVRLSGDVAPGDLWPYDGHYQPTESGTALSVTVHDSHELVGLLLMLVSAGAELIQVEAL
jgi:hypothetical protein